MASEAWVCTLAAGNATGNLTQLYPAACTAGVAESGATCGQLLRRPMQGALHSVQVHPDGTNGGTIEIYDIDGRDAGADVSSAAAITNAQLTAALNAGTAKLLLKQDFSGSVGSGFMTAAGIYRTFSKGLAARFVMTAPAGSCDLNLVVTGGCMKTESRGH